MGILARVKRLVAPPEFEGDEQRTRAAALLNAILIFVFVSGMALPVLAALVAPQDLWLNAIVAIVLGAGSISLRVLLARGRVRLTGVLFCTLFLVVVTVGVFTFGGIRSAVAKSYLLVILMAGLVLGWRGAVGFGLLSVLSAGAAFYAERRGLIDPPHAVSGTGDFIVLFLVFALMAMLLSFALRSISAGTERARSSAAALAERNRDLQAIRSSLERRTAILQTAADVSRGIASVLDPGELMRQVVELVRERFDMYYVGLFLVEQGASGEASDEARSYAVLRAGTGPAGREMVEEGHRLVVGGASMVGQCVALGETRVELDVDSAVLHYRNPLLPETRSELALPLLSRGQVTGALSIQSTAVRGFDEEEISIMQTLADQVAAAVDNARLYAEAREAAERSERVVQQYVEESWDTLVESEPAVSGYRFATSQAGPAEDAWIPSMEDAVQQGDAVVASGGVDGSSLAVPLVQNGVVIGVVGLRRPPGQTWSEDETTLVRSVSEQMTQALENRRLFQVARERARRELVLRQTTDRVRSQADLDAALRVAAREMRRIVGATQVAIRLGTETVLGSAHIGPGTEGEQGNGA